MKLAKVIDRLAAAPRDRVELRRVARALGSELARERVEVLRQVRAELARMSPACREGQDDASSYASGYVAGMLDVTAEYEAGVCQRARRDRARGISPDMALGIELAVRLFQQAATHEGGVLRGLDAITRTMMPDAGTAAAAMHVWASAAIEAGLVSERALDPVPRPVLAEGSGKLATARPELAAAQHPGGAANDNDNDAELLNYLFAFDDSEITQS